MDIIDQLVAVAAIAGAAGAIIGTGLLIMGSEIRRWFRVMARDDLPGWDAWLRHLETHDFGWNGVCGTCRQAGRRDAEMSFNDGQTESQLWGKGYEAGYSDGQGNRPRRQR